MEPKKLTRTVADRKLMGVCGGLAKYFGIDPVIVRVGYAIFAVVCACIPALIIYFLCGLIITEEGK